MVRRLTGRIISLLISLFAVHVFDQHLVFGQTKPTWQTEWDRTIRAAETEGQVVVYSGDTFDSILLEVFQKRNPKIKVTTVTGRGFELGQRVLSERRAGKYIPDVFIQGATTPVVLLSAKAFGCRSNLFSSCRKSWTSLSGSRRNISISTRAENTFSFLKAPRSMAESSTIQILVNSSEMGSFWDLLQPKWKGKIVAIDPLTAAPATHFERFFFFNKELGPEFLRKLFGEMDVTLTRQDERLVDWVAVGKFAFGLFPRARM